MNWDVFVSYGRADRDRVRRVVAALEARELRVFVDETGVADFQGISETITRELTRSKVMLAFYSISYPRRRACQMELTAAYLAGQAEGDPRRRICVINPEPDAGHIEPIELRDARHWPLPDSEQELGLLAERLAGHVASIDGPMSSIQHRRPPLWLPAPGRSGSARFAGRLAELWRIQTALHPAPLVTGSGVSRAAQIRGMGGIGKSLLAEEYALRFGTAFPGGIFWLAADRGFESLRRQTGMIGAALGVVGELEMEELLNRIARQLDKPSLWVFDGVPAGLAPSILRLLRAPHPGSATLLTTRTRRYEPLATPIDLGPLPDEDAYELLTTRRRVADAAERQAVRDIVEDLGGHPLALEVVAMGGSIERFDELRRSLLDQDHDELERLGSTAWALPTGHGASLATTLSESIMDLSEAGRDVLRITALRHPVAVRRRLTAEVLAFNGVTADSADRQVKEGLAELVDGSLVETVQEPWSISGALARTMLRHDPDPPRADLLRRRLATRLEHGVRKEAAVSTGMRAGELERMAAFDLQVELVTRVGLQPLPDGEGSLREALTSLYRLFGTARDVLRSAGVSGAAVQSTADELMNRILRPFLNKWHFALATHEGSRPPGVGAPEHEAAWARATDMRSELAALRIPLSELARSLADISGSELGMPR